MKNAAFIEPEDLFDPNLGGLFGQSYTFDAAHEVMPVKHRHNSVELNLLESGGMTYLWAGKVITVPPRRLVVFWGSIPHQVVEAEAGSRELVMHLPLAWFLAWKLPSGFVDRILNREMAVEPDEGWFHSDLRFFERWISDLSSAENSTLEVLALEVKTRLHRLAKALHQSSMWVRKEHERSSPGDLGKVEEMASFVALHYTEPISLQDVADHVGLHPKYATQLFHRKCGFTLKQYITSNRVHHAEMLLVTTDAKILTVALQSGFGSASRFYTTFLEYCGLHPSDYRKAHMG